MFSIQPMLSNHPMPIRKSSEFIGDQYDWACVSWTTFKSYTELNTLESRMPLRKMFEQIAYLMQHVRFYLNQLQLQLYVTKFSKKLRRCIFTQFKSPTQFWNTIFKLQKRRQHLELIKLEMDFKGRMHINFQLLDTNWE